MTRSGTTPFPSFFRRSYTSKAFPFALAFTYSSYGVIGREESNGRHGTLVKVLFEAGHVYREFQSNLLQDLQTTRRLGRKHNLPVQ